MAARPFLVLENRFACPPEYVARWLTDYRPDDGRWFDREGMLDVRKDGARTFVEGPHPMGRQKMTLTVESPTKWNARTEFTKDGKLLAIGSVVETVRTDGEGTIHRAELSMDAKTLGLRLMAPFMRPMVRKELNEGFARMRAEMEAAFKAGKSPEA